MAMLKGRGIHTKPERTLRISYFFGLSSVERTECENPMTVLMEILRKRYGLSEKARAYFTSTRPRPAGDPDEQA